MVTFRMVKQAESIDESIDETVIQIPDKCEIDLEGIQVPIIEVVFPRLGSQMTSGKLIQITVVATRT